jgi:hypothetical protein
MPKRTRNGYIQDGLQSFQPTVQALLLPMRMGIVRRKRKVSFKAKQYELKEKECFKTHRRKKGGKQFEEAPPRKQLSASGHTSLEVPVFNFLGVSYDLINRTAHNTTKTLEKIAALDLIARAKLGYASRNQQK